MVGRPQKPKPREFYRDGDIRFVEEGVPLPGGGFKTKGIVRHPGAVVIIPVDATGHLLVLRQYRHALGQWIVEFAAGTRELNEDPLQCAQREIREECGVAASDWGLLGILYASPGFCDETQHVYLARGLTPDRRPADDDEQIEALRVSPAEFAEWIARGRVQDAKTLAAYAVWRGQGRTTK